MLTIIHPYSECSHLYEPHEKKREVILISYSEVDAFLPYGSLLFYLFTMLIKTATDAIFSETKAGKLE
jgi:hypothetical protein